MSPYEILGVKPSATTEEIRSAYRKLALKHHPDRNPGNKKAEERFKTISESYEILVNSEKRRFYDAYGSAASGASTARGPDGFGGDLEKIFEMMGAVFGSTIFGDVKQPKTKSAKHAKPCSQCKGEGMIGSDLGFFLFKIVCPKCFGSGRGA